MGVLESQETRLRRVTSDRPRHTHPGAGPSETGVAPRRPVGPLGSHNCERALWRPTRKGLGVPRQYPRGGSGPGRSVGVGRQGVVGAPLDPGVPCRPSRRFDVCSHSHRHTQTLAYDPRRTNYSLLSRHASIKQSSSSNPCPLSPHGPRQGPWSWSFDLGGWVPDPTEGAGFPDRPREPRGELTGSTLSHPSPHQDAG